MKVLFLDVDGVLNNWYTTTTATGTMFMGVNDDLCKRLIATVEKADCDIVISSTWRKSEALMEYLRSNLGDTAKRIKGSTPVLLGETRGAEIFAWLTKHHCTPGHDYVSILDDMGFNQFGALSTQLTRTNPALGLTDKDCEAVLRNLTAGPPADEEKERVREENLRRRLLQMKKAMR